MEERTGGATAILDAWAALDQQGATAAVATVVHVRGSSYRRPSARMLVYPDRNRLGAVSGGCLEEDVVERALRVLRTGQPEYALYNTESGGAGLFLETGCAGEVGIFIECAASAQARSALQFMSEVRASRTTGLAATVFQVTGASGAAAGDRLFLTESAVVASNVVDESTRSALVGALRSSNTRPFAQCARVELPGGSARILVEPVHPPTALMICGAGQDSGPLASLASQLGWQVTVADHRQALLSTEKFAGVRTLLTARPELVAEHLPMDSRTGAVVMSHNINRDTGYLGALLRTGVKYVGVLGPIKRTQQIIAELCNREVNFDNHLLARVYNPVGLDIGSETPEEIALAIVAEIQAVLSHRDGGPLRRRNTGLVDSSSV